MKTLDTKIQDEPFRAEKYNDQKAQILRNSKVIDEAKMVAAAKDWRGNLQKSKMDAAKKEALSNDLKYVVAEKWKSGATQNKSANTIDPQDGLPRSVESQKLVKTVQVTAPVVSTNTVSPGPGGTNKAQAVIRGQ